MKIQEFLTQENWTQGQYARDAHGNVCELEDARAEKFCIIGAAQKCYPKGTEIVLLLLNQDIHGDVLVWNDAPERTFGQVKSLVERLGV